MRRKDKIKISPGELIRFTRQLATLLDVGFPPLEIAKIWHSNTSSQGLLDATQNIAATIDEGGALSDGMRRSPHIFDSLYLNLIQAGELSGRLPATLWQLSDYLERSFEMRKKLTAALIYPTCVILTTAAVMSFLLIFVIPSFADLFADLEAPLPLLTRAVIFVSETILNAGPFILLILISSILITKRLFLSSSVMTRWAELSIKIPLWGSLLSKTAIARSCRVLANTLNAGIPILDAFYVSANSAGNPIIQRELLRIQEDIAEGASISDSISRSTVLPSVTIQMLSVGERSGALDQMLNQVAAQLEEEVEGNISQLKQLIEPLLVVVLGIIVGTVVMAMYLPLLSMGELFKPELS